MDIENINGFVFLCMWLVPPAMFVLTGMLMVYLKGYGTSIVEGGTHVHYELDKCKDGSGILCLFGSIYPLLALVYYSLVIGGNVGFVAAVCYVVFELAGSWLIYGMFTLTGLHSWYEVKEKNVRQQYSMNINFKDVELGQYIIRTFKDDYNYNKNYYRLQLKQVSMEKDLTGEYKVLLNIEEWGNPEFWTEDQIKDKLKEYFKARNLFYIDNENGLGIIKVEPNKPKVLVIE